MEQKPLDRPVAELAGARIPADHGLASLGLIMQLGGSLFLGIAAFMALLPLFAGGQMAGQPSAWSAFLLGSLGAIRAAFHRSAGTALIYGSAAGPFRATRNYIILSIVTTLLTLAVLKMNLEVPTKGVVAMALVLLAWPMTLAGVFASPRIRRMADEALPPAEDMGFEGVAVLMGLLGVLGAGFAGLVLLVIFQMPGKLTSPHILLFIGVFGMLLVRSAMQAKAGVQGTRGVGPEDASESAARYYSFGVVSSVVAGAALLVQFMMAGALHPAMLLMVGILVYMLLCWPLLLRRFFTERNFTVLLAGDEAPVFRRAPDAGLTALGWLLLAMGVIGLADALPTAIFGATASAQDMMFLSGLTGGSGFGGALGRSEWWNVGVSAVQLWAAFELITMSDRHKMATNIYGAVAAAVTLWVQWPMLEGLFDLRGFGADSLGAIMQYGVLALALVVPVGAIVLVNRKLTPQAQARLRGES